MYCYPKITFDTFFVFDFITNHNHYNFSDSIHQHCKKHIIEEISSIWI